MKYLVSISYDGSKFNGFQRLKNEITVQGELERVLSKINNNIVLVKGSGRTDRGVHAFDQKCHFDIDLNLEPQNLIKIINNLIDKSIRINDCIKVDQNFHARFMVKQKTYLYIINIGEYDPINKDYLYNYNYKLDLKMMKKASKIIKGSHNYEKFVSGKRLNYNLNIEKIKITKKKNLIYIEFRAKSFYRYMIRNLVGSLIGVGKGKISLVELKKLVNNESINVKYSTVPACGLYLKKIDY